MPDDVTTISYDGKARSTAKLIRFVTRSYTDSGACPALCRKSREKSNNFLLIYWVVIKYCLLQRGRAGNGSGPKACSSLSLLAAESAAWMSLNSMGPTPTPTRMRLSCNFVNVYTIAYRVQYTFTRVHARIPNGQPREDPCEEKRAARVSVESADKSARIVVRVRLVAS